MEEKNIYALTAIKGQRAKITLKNITLPLQGKILHNVKFLNSSVERLEPSEAFVSQFAF